ncbi:MAG: c-type cytochrome biogenesis protein CcsB [Chlorobi bacterium]|nr:c-type cytochrome biogenesis protein CcsB [Chlorobiota bacterium]
MKQLKNILFSMETMGFLTLVFAASIGVATFIENDFGPAAAKGVVYNALWFEILLFWLAANLVSNIISHRMYRKDKFTLFLFHFAFLIILLGAAITRYISYEGSMHIREGSVSNTIVTDNTFVRVWVNQGTDSAYSEKTVLLSTLRQTAYHAKVSLDGKKFRFKAIKYIPKAQKNIVQLQSGGEPYIALVASSGMGRQSVNLKYNTSQQLGSQILNFGDQVAQGAVNIKLEEGNLLFTVPDTLYIVSMSGSGNDTLLPGSWYPLEARKLYQTKNISFVLTQFYEHGGVEYVSNPNANLHDVLVVEVSSDDEKQQVMLSGGKGFVGHPETIDMNGAHITMTYGSKKIELPFSLKLVDFQLERYPGSNSPSSYASEVILLDPSESLEKPYRIYMNHVLNYKGYRFFQSSYDGDELGTILSVNHDYWGTLLTYIGYALMTLGMFLTPFNKYSRFVLLGKIIRRNRRQAKTVSAVILLLLAFNIPALGQHEFGHLQKNEVPVVDKELARDFGKLLVQTNDGRLEPVNTLSSELLRKISRKSKFYGMNSDQVLLGMVSRPVTWQQVPMIRVGHKEIMHVLGLEGKYASYFDFIDMKAGTYKLQDFVSAAYAKKPAQRNVFDKEIMKVDERMNICYMIYNGQFLKMLPNPTDPYKQWYSPASKITGLKADDSLFLVKALPAYFSAVADNDIANARQLEEGIANYQKKYGAAIIPPEKKVKAEITYNRLMIFDRLSEYYGLIGFVMLIFAFIILFRDSKANRIIIKILSVFIVLGFLAQTGGLILRWYISGHAPWSNGYESLIYIGWVVMLAGLIFSRKSAMTLAATTVLASIILMVAHLSWMDPEVTPLVPVLKSYWLTIHVSIITASYGFLALGMLLGFINLILMIFKSKKNFEGLENKIVELTAINERTLMIGLYMLTVGTFLGGVWANESWGRYWGWDPKETWALVSVLVYSFILHMHYIPGLKNNFSFNFASLVGFSSILMTYFGVNYYLSGLHSYASGDAVPVPTFVYYTLVVIAIIAVWAYINERRFVKKT